MGERMFGGQILAALLVLGSCKDDVGITVSERFLATLSGAKSRPTPIGDRSSGNRSRGTGRGVIVRNYALRPVFY